MSNEKFKVKFGLAVGDTAATIDGTTGNIATIGDLIVGGRNIGTGANNNGIIIENFTTATSVPQNALNLISYSTGTPAVGFGTNLQFGVETAPNVVANAGVVQVEATNITPGAENFKMEFALSSTGALLTRMELDHLGNLALDGGITVSGSTNGSSTFNAPATGSTLVYTLPGSQGAANTALTNDGSGNLTWALPGGGGSTFGNITVGVVTDNTISTTTGDLLLTSTTGVVKTVGDITIGGDDIKASDGTTALTLATSSGNVTVKGDLFVRGNDILSDGGFNNINFPTSTSNVKIIGDLILGGNDIQASDGTVAITTSTSTGNVAVAGDLTVTGNDIKSSTGATAMTLANNDVIFADVIQINGNQIFSSAGGTPAVTLSGTNVAITGTLDVQGGTITESTGALSISTGASNGDITLAPNGTGNVVITLADDGNLTNSRNYVAGAIRNTLAEAAGNIFSFSTTAAGGPTQGISLDNSINTTKRPGVVLRSYGGGLGSGNPVATFITETARGSAATPAGLSSGNAMGAFIAGGYADTSVSGTGPGWVSDTTGNTAASIVFQTSEAWTGGSGAGSPLGTRLRIITNPTGSANAVQTSLEINPQSTLHRSDAFTWSQGKTGTAQTMALDVNGNLTVTGDLTVTGNDIKSSGGTTAISLSGANVIGAGNISTTTGSINASGAFDVNEALSSTANLLDTNTLAGSSIGITTKYWTSSAKTTLSVPQNQNKLGNLRFNSNSDSAGTFVLGAQINVEATENFTPTANGTRIIFFANKQGQSWTPSGHVAVISAAPETSMISSDSITLESSAGTDFVVIDANTAKFNVPVTTEITTTTISEGTTYTPAATVDNNISVQINALAGGTTVIDLASLTGNSRGASYNILVFNNTGSGAPLHVINSRISGSNLMAHTITTGSPRIIVNAYVVGDYATATHLNVA